MTAISINEDQRVFVLKNGSGFTCLGFDVVFKRLKQYAELLKLPMPVQDQTGQMAQYEQYVRAEKEYIASKPTQTLYDPETPLVVKSFLEAYIASQTPVRVYYGDSKTGRVWMEENDVVGRIGRSWGPIKVALLVPTGADGGGAMLTACIVRLIDAKTKVEVYRHPTYSEPVLTFQQGTDPKRPYEVLADGQVHARFSSEDKRQRWCDFMHGKRMTL